MININEYSIHTEASWYNEEDKLVYRPDISLIPRKDIEGVGNGQKFSFKVESNDGIIFELKFFRGGYRTKLMTNINKIAKDMDKISNLLSLNSNIQAFIVVFYQNQQDSEVLEQSIRHKLGTQELNERCHVMFDGLSK